MFGFPSFTSFFSIPEYSICILVRPVTLVQPLTDLTVCEGDIAQLEVKFSQENIEGSWKKNGQPVTASDRVHIVIDKQVHKLLIEDATKDDFGSYSFVASEHDITTTAKLIIQSRSLKLTDLLEQHSTSKQNVSKENIVLLQVLASLFR